MERDEEPRATATKHEAESAGATQTTDTAAAPSPARARRVPVLGPVPAPIVAPAGMIVLILIIAAMFAPRFFIWGNVRTVILDAAIYFILGVGMTFVITARGIDLSIGAITVLAGVGMATAIKDFGVPVLGGILIAFAIGGLCGLINGVVIQKLRLPDLIVTLSTELIFRGLALIYAGGAVFFGFPELIRFLGGGRVLGLPMPIIVGLATIVIGHIVMTYHRIGYRVHAVGGDPVAARRMGINVDRYRIGVYVLMGLMCAFASIVLAGRLDSVVASGAMTLMLHTIAAVIVGGTNLFGGRGTMIGTLLGAILLSLIANAVVLLGFESFWQHVAAGVVIITSIALYSGKAREREAK
jgi:ribose transport system permease protein